MWASKSGKPAAISFQRFDNFLVVAGFYCGVECCFCVGRAFGIAAFGLEAGKAEFAEVNLEVAGLNALEEFVVGTGGGDGEGGEKKGEAENAGHEEDDTA